MPVRSWHDVLPPDAVHDFADDALRNSELSAESGLAELPGCVKRPNLGDGTPGQLGVPMPFPARNKLRMFPGIVAFSSLRKLRMLPRPVGIPGGCQSSFGFGVLHIVGLRAQKKMARIHAKPHVTFVADAQRSRIHSILQEVGEAVRPDHPVFPSWAETNLSISTLSASRPQPTFIRPSFRHLDPISGDVARGNRGERDTICDSHWGLLDQGLNRQSRCGADTLRGSFHSTPRRRQCD